MQNVSLLQKCRFLKYYTNLVLVPEDMESIGVCEIHFRSRARNFVQVFRTTVGSQQSIPCITHLYNATLFYFPSPPLLGNTRLSSGKEVVSNGERSLIPQE